MEFNVPAEVDEAEGLGRLNAGSHVTITRRRKDHHHGKRETQREGGNMTKKYKTEAVMLEIAKKKKRKKGSTAKCRLRPVAGGTAIEIGENKYLVGHQETGVKKARIAARLWRLNKAGTTEITFDLDKKLHEWALAAWQAQRKVSLVVDVQDKKNNRITKITVL